MTCIVGLCEGNTVYMGGDSSSVSDNSVLLVDGGKVFTNRGFLFGFASSFRMGQLLKYKFVPPVRKFETDLMTYMVTDFIDGVRACFKEGGFARTREGEEVGGNFLVGHAGRLFRVDEDYNVVEAVCSPPSAKNRSSYIAIGCGVDVAMGSMFSSSHLKPKERIKLALEASAHHYVGVTAPFSYFAL